jgi:hypothetical protein
MHWCGISKVGKQTETNTESILVMIILFGIKEIKEYY